MKRHRLVGGLLAAMMGPLLCMPAHARSDRTPAVQPPPVEEAQPVPDAQASGEPTLRDVMAELARLREEVARLRELLDAHLSSTAADLQAENERLRAEIETLSAQKGRALPPLPMPDKELLKGLSENDGSRTKNREEVEEQTVPGKRGEPVKEAVDKTQAKADGPPPPAEFKSEVVAEWGRTPTDAAKSIPKVGSLKGMICVVPPGSRDEDLIAFARKLHKEFE